jgi:hypothetical protein
MFQFSNQHAKQHLYIECVFDAPIARPLGGVFIRASRENKFLIIRHFSGRGGLGNAPSTQTIEGCLKYHDDRGRPLPACHILGEAPRNISITDLQEEFRKGLNFRTYTVESLRIPFMDDATLASRIVFPADLALCHSLRLVERDYGFIDVSMEGSCTKFQQAASDMLIVMSVGSKVWALFPNSEKNVDTNRNWTPAEGLSVFDDVLVVDTQVGDLLGFRKSWYWRAYTVLDSLMHGYYYSMENLDTDIDTATV